MRTIVYNREEMENSSEAESHLKIVMHDPDLSRPKIQVSSSCKGILYLSFDDISYESFFDKPFSNKDAAHVVKFLKDATAGVDLILVSCEAGRSRSPGMAAAIEEHYSGVESKYFWDHDKEPNRLVYEKMKDALVNFIPAPNTEIL